MSTSEAVGDSVTLDLFIGEDDEDNESNDSKSEAKTEALCLRILSNEKTRFRFGGLQITVKSPAFEVGKIFNVTLDANNTISGIESFRDSSWDQSPEGGSTRTPSPKQPGSRKISLVGSVAPKPARIIINPSNELASGGEELPILSAHIVVEEKDAAASSLRARRQEIERIFETMTIAGLNQPSNSFSKVSIGVGTASSDKDHLRLDTSGNLRRVKSWKK
ncbi:hypothetical protein HDE_06804 [Halotydeus destructor]|nr:hypothetical protein HDE_06804 [Halotydeus destructor]